MANGHVFGAVRATTIAALCAGAGLALAGCTKSEEPKPAAGGGTPVPEKQGGDMKCSPGSCSAKDK